MKTTIFFKKVKNPGVLGTLFRFIRKTLTSNRETAEDLIQEAIFSAWKNRAKLEEKKLISWLRVVIKNRFIDLTRMKSAKLPRDTSFDLSDEPRMHPAIKDREYIISTTKAVLCEQDKIFETLDSELVRAIKQLNPRRREIFLLRALVDLDYKKLASRYKLSVGAVKKEVFYARKEIKEWLDKAGYVI